ncbi:DUF5615 family PIN-like protein [Acidobacteriota bacterium]
MKIYLDEDLSPEIARALRKKGIDAISAHDAGNTGLTDAEQLAFAAQEGRCLVTRNARHFILLARSAVRQHESHAGILICSPRLTGSEFATIANRLSKIAMRYRDGLGSYDILYF